MRSIILSVICSIALLNGFSQIHLQGRVTDQQTALPVEGVTVREKANPRNAAITDNDGRYSITLMTKNPVEFSHTSYNTETRVPSASQLDIGLTRITGTLTEVVVVGFQNDRKLLEVAGALNVVKAADLQRGDNSSIAGAINAIPGVRMEEQAPGGSTRLSIRGSVLRSPFGIRDIKVYWNDIPFTSAGGSTSYALFEPSVIGNIEIIKGPAGSIYGAGTGGVMIMTSRKPSSRGQTVEASMVAGSYGLLRWGLNAGSSTDKVQVNATYNEQYYDGYRELQSATYRKIASVQSAFTVSEKQKLIISAFNTRTNFDLPGGLTKDEFQKDPRYVVPVIDTLDGRVTSTQTNVAIAHQYQFSHRFSNTTSLYTSTGTTDHPFGSSHFNASYGKANSSSIGGRTRFVYYPNRSQTIKLNFGGEFQRDIDAEKSFTNEKGQPGNVTGLYDFTSLQYFFFLNAEVSLPLDLILTAGGSYNRLHYKVEDFYNPPGNINESQKLSFKGDISPRIALLKKLNAFHAVFAGVSAGFGPPTPAELSVGGIPNTTLRSERGTNYEVGARGRSRNGRFQYDMNVYLFRLNDIIISSRLASGVDRYDNSGSADQKGVELMLDYNLLRNTSGWLKEAKLFSNFTYNDYQFDEFISKDEQSGGQIDNSGNYLPGIPDVVVASGFDLQHRSGLYMNGTWQLFGTRYITNDNKEKDPGYEVANVRMGFKYKWGRTGIHCFAGINNLFNESYSEFLAINGFGGRYYLPSPARNYYGGLSINYSFNK